MDLAQLFNHYGSDKDRNGYTQLYDVVLSPHRADVKVFLEIGIGTMFYQASTRQCRATRSKDTHRAVLSVPGEIGYLRLRSWVATSSLIRSSWSLGSKRVCAIQWMRLPYARHSPTSTERST